ncbi:hypothetical protein D9615_010075 [Tricholomella constricta]|uniref:J domain-containing protein n=1 Tax=Tricholomella constricta TaxID=117010 RepID=A0A8H5GSL6_9AGAR|nr:hypothetical protein D9615_010075 [Tricholomella constricta]
MLSIRRHILRQRPARLFHSSVPRSRPCPSCSRPLPSSLPACINCGHISSLSQNTKHHDIFDLPYEPNPFVVDISTLKQRFRNAQALCHPDSWASKGSNKQDIAQALSGRINEAYQCLLNPLSRAEYILQRHHVPISETEHVEDIEFMAEIMQARETVEEAEDVAEIEILLQQNNIEIKRTEEELEGAVGKAQWADVKSAAIRLRYLQGIQSAAKKWLDNH